MSSIVICNKVLMVHICGRSKPGVPYDGDELRSPVKDMPYIIGLYNEANMYI
jgi:hypothetical protein